MNAVTDPVDDELVNEICGDVRKLLASWEAELRDQPEKLQRKLWLMALEREQIVAVAYRDETVLVRLEQLDIPDHLRAVIRQTLAWIWKDEEIHVNYARGRLVRAKNPVPTTVIFGRQLVGAISGWVSATSHHGDRREHPLSVFAAKAIVTAARVTRRVPERLARELSHQSFVGYCALNVALEESAALGYELLIKHVAPDEVEAVQRIADDERRHQQCFRVLSAAMTGQGMLRPGVEADKVINQLAAISPFHLPAGIRKDAPVLRQLEHADRHVVRNGPKVGAETTIDDALWPMLDELQLDKSVRAAAPGPVVLKGSFMLGYHHADRSNVASPELIDSVARYVRQHGATDVVLIEALTIYDRYYANRSVSEVAKYFGFTSPNYRLHDASTDQIPVTFDRGLCQQSLSKTWVDAPLRIVISKLRGDPTEVAHLSFPSMQGMGLRTDSVLTIDREVDFRTAVLMTVDVAPPDFGIVDGWGPCADGPIGVMGCRTPATLRRLWASHNIISLDATVVADIGEPSTSSVYLRRARDWFGVDINPPASVGVRPIDPAYRRPRHTLFGRFVCATAYPMYIFAGGRGNYFVPQMDEDAFPQLGRTNLIVRAIRRTAQLVFGIRPPR